jgi:hypothetical protein
MSTIAKAKDHFKHDLLKGFRIQRVLDGIYLELEYRAHASTITLVDAVKKQPREFKTFDAAVRAAEEIGFDVSALFSPR